MRTRLVSHGQRDDAGKVLSRSTEVCTPPIRFSEVDNAAKPPRLPPRLLKMAGWRSLSICALPLRAVWALRTFRMHGFKHRTGPRDTTRASTRTSDAKFLCIPPALLAGYTCPLAPNHTHHIMSYVFFRITSPDAFLFVMHL